MSGEAFETVLSCDMKTAPDGRGVLTAESGTGSPRWHEDRSGWASVLVYAEDAVKQAADAVAEQSMEGITGDHPEKREQCAAILRAAAYAVRTLALDHAHDSALTDDDWAHALALIREAT